MKEHWSIRHVLWSIGWWNVWDIAPVGRVHFSNYYYYFFKFTIVGYCLLRRHEQGIWNLDEVVSLSYLRLTIFILIFSFGNFCLWIPFNDYWFICVLKYPSTMNAIMEQSLVVGSVLLHNDKTPWCYGRISVLEKIQISSIRWTYIRNWSGSSYWWI